MDPKKQKEESLLPENKKMEALGRLACKVAHDYNNILGAIEGYATLAMNAARPDDPLRQDMQEIRASVAKAAALGKKLTAFGGRQMMQKIPCGINEIISNTLKRPELAPDDKFRIEAVLGPGLPGLAADTGLIEQALACLLVNAREAMPGGGTAAVASSSLRLEGGAIHSPDPAAAGELFVKVSVSDGGAGISAETCERLFEPLFSASKRGVGVGLGLAVVYGVARQHNGWVEVKCGPGRGSEFTLFLPAAK